MVFIQQVTGSFIILSQIVIKNKYFDIALHLLNSWAITVDLCKLKFSI